MAAVNETDDEWQCMRCTLLNNLENIQCILCGELRPQKPKNKDNYGCIIYRIEPFTINELDEINTLYNKNPSKQFGKYPIILYPNNDINYKRSKSSDIALLSSAKYNKEYITTLISKYDRQFCYGIVVQFHDKLLNYYKKIEILPIFNEFKQIMDKQFNYLHRNYIQNGHDIIIASPNKQEILSNTDTYYTNKITKQQTIFHTLGTHNNGLPISYYTYIQQKINEMEVKKVIYPKQQIINTDLLLMKNDNNNIDKKINEEKKQDFKNEYNDNEINELYNDDEDEKEINVNDIKYCKNDPIEVFNENKNVWIRGVFIGEYVNDNNCIQYFVEIPDVLESKIISMDTKYVRYLQEMEQFMDHDLEEEYKQCNDEKAEELIETEEKYNSGEMKKNKVNDDENYWENVNDFVLKEYVIDIIDAMPHLLTNMDLFISKIEILGINSNETKMRALKVIKNIQNEQKEELDGNKNDINSNIKTKQPYMIKSVMTNKAIYVHVIENGYYMNSFVCRYCDNKQSKGGIELHNCKHAICYKCFPKYIQKCMDTKKAPKCKKCDKIFNTKDIEMHINDENIKENINKIINNKNKKYKSELSDQETDSDSDSDNTDSDTESDSDSDSESDSYNSDSSLDYDDKILKKQNKNADIIIKDDTDKIEKSKKRINNRKKGIFYCSNIKCNGKIHIKSKKKRANKLTFKCPECKYKNCINCGVIHKQIKDKKIRKLECNEYQFLYNNKFLNRWKKFKINKALNPYKALKKHSKMMKSYKVKRGSIEWNEVISNMQTVQQFNVTRIDRVQNSNLYSQYYKHCKKMILKRKMTVNQMSVWHGTRQTEPSMIWKGSGFDVRYANVGGCIWFAIQNNYSMGGYQFRKHNGENQVFLAFVATGDYESVKFIRNGQILNVYKNQTMYPAYVVTYNANGY